MALIDTNKNCVLFAYNALPIASNVVNIEDNVLISPNVDSKDYNELDGQLASKKSYKDNAHITTSFNIKAKLRGNNKAGDALDTPPAISHLLKSAGLTETIGADNVIYTINHGTVSPSQAIVYLDGKKRVISGIQSNFKLSGTVGECAMVEFAAQGYTTIEDTNESNPTVTLDSESLMVVSSVSLTTIGGSVFNMKSFDFDLNNETKDRYAVGIARFERKDLDPKVSLTGYRDSADTSWTELKNDEIKTIVIQLGNVAGQTVTLTIESATPINNSESDDDGKLSIKKEYRCTKHVTSGNHFELMWS